MDAIRQFDKQASCYLKANSFGSSDALAITLYFHSTNIRFKSYLDLGSGPGTSAWPFLSLGVKRLVAVDSSLEMLKLFNENLFEQCSFIPNLDPNDLDVKTMQVDFITQSLEIDGVFDCVGAFGLFNYLPFKSMESVISKVSDHLSITGYFFVSIRVNEEEESSGYMDVWPDIWENSNVYVHILSHRNVVIPKNDCINVYYHSKKHFCELLTENNFKIVSYWAKTGIFVIKKINK